MKTSCSHIHTHAHTHTHMPTAHLPDSIGELKKLETLNLTANSLSSLPEGIINLKALKTVNLSQNSLQTFPLFLCQLTHLDFADLSDNKIEELPEGVQVLNAVELNVNRNSISVIPASIAKCKRLKVLRIEENTLSLMGIPPVILTDSSISLLCMEGNLFEIKELKDLPEYEKVHVYASYNIQNSKQGRISPIPGHLPTLRHLII